VQQVRAGVVPADGLAAFDVDAGQRLLAGGDLALGDAARVPNQLTGDGVGGVGHLEHARVGADLSRVAHLAAGLGVERRAVEDELDIACLEDRPLAS
jgi:hypothetical protein